MLHPGSLLFICVCVGGGICAGVHVDGELLIKGTILNHCIYYCNIYFCSYSLQLLGPSTAMWHHISFWLLIHYVGQTFYKYTVTYPTGLNAAQSPTFRTLWNFLFMTGATGRCFLPTPTLVLWIRERGRLKEREMQVPSHEMSREILLSQALYHDPLHWIMVARALCLTWRNRHHCTDLWCVLKLHGVGLWSEICVLCVLCTSAGPWDWITQQRGHESQGDGPTSSQGWMPPPPQPA